MSKGCTMDKLAPFVSIESGLEGRNNNEKSSEEGP